MERTGKGNSIYGRLWLSAMAVAVLLTGCGQAADTAISEEKMPSAQEGSGKTDLTASSGETGPEGRDSGEKFYLYSWDGELGRRLEYAYDANPWMEERIVYVNTGSREGYWEAMERLFASPDAEEYPDMIAMEDGYMKKWVNSDYTVPVTDCGITEADLLEMYPYTINAAMDQRDNRLKGLSWQICPGVFFYRADLAESLLGVKNPREMQERIGSWEDFLTAAREIKENSGGAVGILPSYKDVAEPFRFSKSRPWVTADGTFCMDDAMLEYMDAAYALETEGLTVRAEPGSERWTAGLSGESVFGYFGGLEFLSGEMAEYCGGEAAGQGTYGLWNFCRGPVPFYRGGTWLGATAGCSDPALAGQIMKALCCDEETMGKMAAGTADAVNHKALADEPGDIGKVPDGLLRGQDFVRETASLAEETEVFWKCAYDREMDLLLEEELAAYIAGEKTRGEAVADFKKAVAAAFPSVAVE